MIFIDRDGNINSFKNVDKFIEIEFNQADESGKVFFIQVARDPGFDEIVGIKIEMPKTAWVV